MRRRRTRESHDVRRESERRTAKVQLHRNNAASEKHGEVSKVPWQKKREDDPRGKEE